MTMLPRHSNDRHCCSADSRKTLLQTCPSLPIPLTRGRGCLSVAPAVAGGSSVGRLSGRNFVIFFGTICHARLLPWTAAVMYVAGCGPSAWFATPEEQAPLLGAPVVGGHRSRHRMVAYNQCHVKISACHSPNKLLRQLIRNSD
jgi:hypothetical protein